MKPVGLVTRSIVIPERETRDEPFMIVQFLSPHSDAYEAAVDEAIATCDGNLRGALKALIVANEFLERDLEKALASYQAPSIAHDGNDRCSLRPKIEQEKID
jgi:hypothetical protein